MNFSTILIITYGRSGSTLLQGLLNSTDKCLIRGENYNFCYGLFKSYKSLIKAKQDRSKKGRKPLRAENPWYGADLLDVNRFLEDARNLIFNQLNPEKLELSCLGFKEIRYVQKNFHGKELHDYLDFLEKLFPNSAFIILTRNHDQVSKSGWWRLMDAEEVKERLGKFEKNIFAYCKNKSNTFTIDYADILEHNEKLVEMFHFIGASYNDINIKKVLLSKHSY